MADLLTITYRHDCPPSCTRNGQIVEVRPECLDGVAFISSPQCIEGGGNELREIGREAR